MVVLRSQDHSVELLQPRVPWPSMHQHCHDWHELILVVRGSYASRLDAERFEARPGQAIVLPAGTTHRPEVALDGRCMAYLLQWWRPAPSGAMVVTDRGGRLAAGLRWLWMLHQEPDEEGVRAPRLGLLAALLHELATLCRRAGEPAAGGDDLVERLITHLQRNLGHNITLELLSRHAGLSPSSLSRRFRARTGQAPMAYLRRLRAEYAAALAAEGATLADICPLVGYGRPEQVSRLLRLVGVLRRRAVPTPRHPPEAAPRKADAGDA